jgi:hypothetical protein
VVSITVNEAGNQVPTLAAIGAKNTTEGIQLNFNISASDPDGTLPGLAASPLPSGASFIDNGDGTGTFDWTPGFTQVGIYNVTFVASDGSQADSEQVSVSVIEAGNQTPLLTTIGARSTSEGVNLNFGVTAVDPDGTTPGLTTSSLPVGATYTDHGDGSATFDWTPNFTQSGSYLVIFRATDGAATDSEVVSLTVNDAGNQSPVLAAIGPQSVVEGASLNLAISALDPDGTTPGLGATPLPAGASFVDNGNGTGTFNWTPDFTQSGGYIVTFTASDGVATDIENVTITVIEAGNQTPLLSTIGSQTTVEGANLNFLITSTDVDGTIPSLSTSGLPSGASFTANGDGTGTFDWTPDFTQAGAYNVTFRATDGLATDSEIVVITVNSAGNQVPVLALIGSKSTTEGINLNFGVSATDADATLPSLTTSALPTGASFVDNGDGTGSFDWTPDFQQAGLYSVTFRAADGVATDSEVVAISVGDAGNQSPIQVAIGSQLTTENTNLTFGVSATDPDGTTPSLSASPLPSGATYTNNGNGTGTFNWTPDFTQAAVYNVTFRASDGVLADSEIVAITVLEAGNQTPLLSSIGAQIGTEGANLNFGISAVDPDSTVPILTTSALPPGAAFTDNGNGTGTFDWTPDFTQSGSYNVVFRAGDGVLVDTEIVSITINEAGNQAPVLALIGSRATTEGVNLSFGVSAADPDGTTPILTTSSLPPGASFTDNGNGTGSFNWTPDFTQSGTYPVTFFASDGVASDSEVVNISVNEVGNQAPLLLAIGGQSTTESVNLSFGTMATDADATTPIMTAANLPAGATYTDNLNGTGSFSWTPDFTQAGIYSVIFIASDGSLADSEVVAITVNEAGNQTPVLAAIGARSVAEGDNLNFGVSATDPDATTPALSALTLPSGASFTDNGNGTGSFDWSPDFTQGGVYNITFVASDGFAADSEVVAVTVNDAGNQSPVLAAIGAKATTEGTQLTFGVSAVDPDLTTPGLNTSSLPAGASFIDNGDGTGTFDWTPDFTQSGTYDVTIRATDGAATDSEIVSIVVNEAGNQRPILAAIGSRNTTEGVTLNFGVSGTDPDATIPGMLTSTLPTGASFTDNGDGTGSFSWTPDFTQSGTELVVFIASDGVLADSELVTITVNEGGNQQPALAAIGNRTTTEGANLNFSVSADDPDSTTPALTAAGLPAGASFVDNNNGSGVFDWTPTFVQAGVYNVTFVATDGALSDTEVVQITVNNAGNQSPVLAAIGPKATTEGVSLNFGVSASDPDATIPSLTAASLPSGASFVDNGDGTGTFGWLPTFAQSGSYNITFVATDGVAADSEVVSVSVSEAGNQTPILAAIGAQNVIEGLNLNLAVSATDPDLTTPVLNTSTLPLGSSFTDHGNGTGTFDWSPTFTQAGPYSVTFRASDGVLQDTEVVIITVIESGNQTPVLASIGAQGTTEGTNLNFGISASDADGTTPSLTALPLPGGATFTDNGDGSGTFDWTPDFTQSGSYDITFAASDGTAADSEVVTVTVNESGNQAPILASIGSQSTTEGLTLAFGISALDPDSTTPTLSTSGLPTGATFTDNGDGTGSFGWTPGFTQSGTYNVTFFASDGSATDSEIVLITVFDAGNQRPVLAAIGPQSTNENVPLTFGVSATDPDGTIPSILTANLPAGATFTDNGNGTGSFNWTPDFTQSGSYPVTFLASDGVAADSEFVIVTVNELGNQAPTLAAIGARSTNEGANLNFGVSAVDPDATIPALSVSPLPPGASFTDNLNGTGSFDWTPDFTQSGVYNLTFVASDGSLADTEVVVITVNDAGNQIPLLAAIGPQSATEGTTLAFGVTAIDPDSTVPVLTTSALPSGATFTDNGDGSGNFDWSPDFTQSGTYAVTFRASDGTATDSEIVTITINEAGNQPPVLAAIGARSTNEGANLNFGVSAVDPDATLPALSTSALPTGATFTNNGDGTGTFDWTPSFTQSGSYLLIFIAADGVLADSEIVTITVNESGNQPPVLAAIGPQNGTEGQILAFPISATDPDGSIPVLTSSSLPAGGLFTDNNNGTASVTWIPGFTQSGVYNVTFYASDGAQTDSEQVVITINDAGNQLPVLASIGSRATTEGINLNFGVSATDPDATIPALNTNTLPTGATFTDNGNGTGTFDWTPDFTQSGSYNVIFRATDGIAVDTEIVTISVGESGNQAPVLAAIGARSVLEGAILNFAVTATDPDATTPVLSVSTLPFGASFVDNGNGTGVFDWTPNFIQSQLYSVTFRASDGVLVDSEVVLITVNEAGNQSPQLAAIPAQSTTENVPLVFTISATDPDSTTPSFLSAQVPAGAVFGDNGDGSADFSWTPDFTQSGIYNVVFIATDGALADTDVVVITVNEAGNQTPVLATIGPKVTGEVVALNFSVSAVDPDSTLPALTAAPLPLGATFTDNGDGTGVFDWTPTFSQQGVYDVTFAASDGLLADTEVVSITVVETNTQPTLTPIGSQTIAELATLNFVVAATDAELDSLAFTSTALPSGAVFTDNFDNTATFDWTPDSTQQGTYSVTFYVSDPPGFTDSEQVIITVTRTNVAPVLTSIGDKLISENANLSFGVTAVDFDGDPLTITTSSLPAGAAFTPSGAGAGTFDWTPDFTQAGAYPVTFRAADTSGAVDSEIILITVVEVDRAPVLAAIGAQGVVEGNLLEFAVVAVDPDGQPVTLSIGLPPPGASFVDSGNGSGLFSWTPDFTQAGFYAPTFFATADTLVDSEVVVINVNEAGNQPPLLGAIGPQSVDESLNLLIVITGTDPETVPVLLAENAPPGAVFVDSGTGTATFDWTPGFFDAGTYQVRFIATDGVSADTELVDITVNNTNQSPILTAIGPQTANEGDTILLAVSAVDPDSSIPALLVDTLPAGATFIDSGNGNGSFLWPVSFLQSGAYTLVFQATDGVATDSEFVGITINEVGNQGPQWVAVADTLLAEGATLSLVLTALDADGPVLLLTSDSLPENATFADSTGGVGYFDFAPNFLQAGIYTFNFFATDGILSDTLTFNVAVTEAGDQPPVYDSIAPAVVDEGDTLSLRIAAVDPESTVVTLTTSNLPPNATFVDSGNGAGALTFLPTYLQAGIYNVNILATDAGVPPLTSILPLEITVLDVNRPPVLDSIGPKSFTIERLSGFNIRGSDSTALPGNQLILTTSPLPFGASFVDCGNGVGRFQWNPADTQVAVYSVTFTVTDNGTPSLNAQEVVSLNVVTTNRPPVLDPIGPKFVLEGDTLQFLITATDPDSTIPSFMVVNAPPTATIFDQGNGSALFTYAPLFTEAGLQSLEFRASDGLTFDKEVVLVQVGEAGNQPPTMLVQGASSVVERDTLVATILANDPDSTADTITVASALPENSTFTYNGDGTATFEFVPWYTQEGPQSVTFATDDGQFVDTITYNFTVIDVGNQVPFIHAFNAPMAPIPDMTFREQLRDSLFVGASDFDSTTAVLTASNLPSGATFTDFGNNIGRLEWTPTFDQAGVYQVTFFATDGLDNTLYDSQLVTLTVNNFFPAPVWFPTIVKNHTIPEGVTFDFDMTTITIDTFPEFRAEHLPPNAVFTDNNDGTCNLLFTPDFFQAGTDSAVLFAVHPEDASIETPLVLQFSIPNTPQPPLWRPKNDTTVSENIQLFLIVTADDPDNTIPLLSAENLPAGATFDVPFQGAGSATGRVAWIPNFSQQGTYPIRFIASDGTGSDTMIVNVTVADAGNQAPFFTVLPTDQALILPESLTVRVAAVDPDSTIPSLRVENLPPNAVFVDSLNGAGSLVFKPDSTQIDLVYQVDFIASDGAGAEDRVTVTYYVYDFIRGDPDGSGTVTSSDVIFLVNFVFKAGPAPVPYQAGDVDKSGAINAADVIYLVNFVFKGGPPPPLIKEGGGVNPPIWDVAVQDDVALSRSD